MLDDAVQVVRVDQREPAVRMVAQDRHVRRLAVVPTDDRDAARPPRLARQRFAPTGAAAAAQAVFPRFPAIPALVIAGEARFLPGHRHEADAVHAEAVAAAVAPLDAQQTTGGSDELGE